MFFAIFLFPYCYPKKLHEFFDSYFLLYKLYHQYFLNLCQSFDGGTGLERFIGLSKQLAGGRAKPKGNRVGPSTHTQMNYNYFGRKSTARD